MSASASGVVRDRVLVEEERDFLLHSLRDLEAEHDAGDIDEEDYSSLRDDYTSRAAVVLRELERIDNPPPPEPEGPEAEDQADPSEDDEDEEEDDDWDEEERADDEEDDEGAASRGWLSQRGKKRALLGAVAVVLAVGIGVGIVHASGTRLPGETISGDAIGSEAVAEQLLTAQKAESGGHAVAALEDYQDILKTNPLHPQALTGEGWLLIQTEQAEGLRQGVLLLAKAEKADPTYTLAYLYLGTGEYLGEDYADAVTQFQYYLAHNPDPSLVAGVRQTLSEAQAELAASPSTT
jgi:hypothetical protein